MAAEFLRKGSLVYVEGRLSTNRWEDQQGIVRYTTEIIGTELQMLSPRQDQGQRGQGSDDNASQNGYSGYGSNYSGRVKSCSDPVHKKGSYSANT